MQKKTYTVKELTALLGIATQTIYSGISQVKFTSRFEKYHYVPTPGSKLAALWAAMLFHGVTWDQVRLSEPNPPYNYYPIPGLHKDAGPLAPTNPPLATDEATEATGGIVPPPLCSLDMDTSLKDFGGNLMNQKTYTISELAALLGMSYSAVASAKSNRDSRTVMPGSKRAAVLIGMQNLGITWDQIVNVPPGNSTNGAIPVSELLASSEKTAPREESFIPFPDTLPPLPPEPVNAVESEQKRYCYLITLRGRDSAGSYVWKAVSMGGFKEKKVTPKKIGEAIELAGLHEALPVAVSYLGAMTKEEFENV